jgi:hypothetical protein
MATPANSLNMRYVMTLIAILQGATFGDSAHAAGMTDAELETALNTISTGCTRKHGFDPTNPGEVGAHELARGEKAWRECLYAGIRTDLEPRSGFPAMYERVIAQDVEFTTAIEAGKMTRFERWQRNRMNKEIIVLNEATAENDGAQRRQQEFLKNPDQMQALKQQGQIENALRLAPRDFVRLR